MRIVAGSARGRRLVVPTGNRTRPTTDRVREAMFNALFSLGAIDAMRYCDLYAGSGALGLEALSRGAEHVTFVDRDRVALEALGTNIDTLGFGDRSTVVAADADRWLAAPPDGTRFDVVVADPPYDYSAWDQLLESCLRLAVELVVVESDRSLQIPPGWESLRERAYGSTVVTILGGTSSHRDAQTRESNA